MKRTTLQQVAFAGTLSLTLLCAAALPAMAQDVQVRAEGGMKVRPLPISGSVRMEGKVQADADASTTRAARMEEKLGLQEQNAKDRASNEIDNRIQSLTKLMSRIQGMKNISTNVQASLATNLQGQISALSSLGASISDDTSTTTLKTDLMSITKAYRIYALIEPQAMILAAVDRIGAVASQMSELSAKLQARISMAGASADVNAANATLADYNANIADAQVQAQAAASAVVSLKPDNGDNAIFQSNLAALKDAHAKIQTAQKDLEDARKDVQTIRVSLSVKANAAATTTESEGH